MLISNIQVADNGTHRTIQAQVGPYPLWFRHNAHSSAVAKEDATPFLISALIPAMLLGEDIEIHENFSVSEKLMSSIPEIQEIFHCWNPIFKNIRVRGREKNEPGENNGGCAAFFSAGVDSIYTALKHKEEINSLILINGFDFNMNSNTWGDLVKRNTDLAALLDKQLILVETNLKEFTAWFRMKRYVNFGASLATIANLLEINKTYISGHVTYEKITPAGVHPLLDPLWSTESCEIIHAGLEADRTAKIALFRNLPEILSRLWVCWENPKSNCGKCSKCIRSYVAMRLLGIENFKFDYPVQLDDVRKLTIEDDEMLSFFEHFRDDALKLSMPDLVRTINKIILKYKTRRFLVDVDTYFLASRLKKTRKMLNSHANSLADINVLPRASDQPMLEGLLKDHNSRNKIESTAIIGSVFS